MRPVMGRSRTSCSVVRLGPVPRDTQAWEGRAVTTAGAWAGPACAFAPPACAFAPRATSAAPAAAAAAPFFNNPRRESPCARTVMVGSWQYTRVSAKATRTRGRRYHDPLTAELTAHSLV